MWHDCHYLFIYITNFCYILFAQFLLALSQLKFVTKKKLASLFEFNHGRIQLTLLMSLFFTDFLGFLWGFKFSLIWCDNSTSVCQAGFKFIFVSEILFRIWYVEWLLKCNFRWSVNGGIYVDNLLCLKEKTGQVK